MREILFRGKRTDNGEWFEGFYTCVADVHYILSGIFDSLTNGIINTRGYKVVPETVSQFTGLYDKNSNKIFEGDIIRTKKYGKVTGHVNVNDYDTFQVVYEPAVFRLVKPTRGFNLVGQSIDWEVIGNIYDNPELLEGRDEIL